MAIQHLTATEHLAALVGAFPWFTEFLNARRRKRIEAKLRSGAAMRAAEGTRLAGEYLKAGGTEKDLSYYETLGESDD